MIPLQKPAQGKVHTRRVNTGSRQVGEKHDTRGHVPARALTFLVVADTGVDEDGMMASAHEPGLHREDQVAGRWIHSARLQPGLMRSPILWGRLREER